MGSRWVGEGSGGRPLCRLPALAALEKNLSGLVSLSVEERRELNKMGPKSEMFARKVHDVIAQSPDMMPGGCGQRIHLTHRPPRNSGWAPRLTGPLPGRP